MRQKKDISIAVHEEVSRADAVQKQTFDNAVSDASSQMQSEYSLHLQQDLSVDSVSTYFTSKDSSFQNFD